MRQHGTLKQRSRCGNWRAIFEAHMVIRCTCSSVSTGVSCGELEDTWWAEGVATFARDVATVVDNGLGLGLGVGVGVGVGVAHITVGTLICDNRFCTAGAVVGVVVSCGTLVAWNEAAGLKEQNLLRGSAGVVSGLKTSAGFVGVSHKPPANKQLLLLHNFL